MMGQQGGRWTVEPREVNLEITGEEEVGMRGEDKMGGDRYEKARRWKGG